MFRKKSYGIAVIGILLILVLMLMMFGSRLFTDIDETTQVEKENQIVVGVSRSAPSPAFGRPIQNRCRMPLHRKTDIF